MSVTPRGAELWRKILDSRLLDVHTAIPAKVVSFDAAEQTIVAKPLIQHVIPGTDGSELVEEYPELRGVPVLYPRAGGYIVAFPLQADDIVTVLFNEWSIENYREKGRLAHPVDVTRHGLAGAVALPVGPYKASATISETIDALLLGTDGGVLIRVDGSKIELGEASAGDKVSLDSKIQAELSKISAAISQLAAEHVIPHTYVAPLIPAAPGPTVPPAPSAASYTKGATNSTLVTIKE